MSARLLAALSLAACAAFATAAPLSAADLDGDEYYESERYSYESRRSDSYVDYDRVDRARFDVDDDDDDDTSWRRRVYGYGDGRCLPRHAIRQRLRDDGWSDLDKVDVRDGAAIIKARRTASGQMFALKVDRCTGDIIDARRSHPVYGEYAPRY